MLKPFHYMAHIRILLLEECHCTMITNHAEVLRCMQLGVVLVTEDILEDIACTHSFAMKAYSERSGERAANRLSSTFKTF